MRRQLLSGVLLLIALTLGCEPSWAGPFRILYAEQVELPLEAALDPALQSAARKPEAPAQLALNAYGQQFEMRIESNASLTTALAPALLIGKTLYRGEIVGLAGSWARFTVLDGDVYGAFWDGSDFYSVAPGHAVEPFLAAPLTESARDATFVYRLSDTEGGVQGSFCGTSTDVAARGAALTQYRSLVSELKSLPMLATASVPLQIEVALIADFELSTQFSDPTGAMLARANIADDIFSSQVGVTLIPTDLLVFNDSSNPFQSTSPQTLMAELSSFRNSTPAIRDRGLAHLLTGKNLDGDVIGYAAIGALCDPVRGVGVSEGWHDSTTAALIMTHELGHNFGAPHDGEAGSACASTPFGYLMSPTLNYSRTFSSCSLTQMQPHIQAAACVEPLKFVDVSVQAPAQVQAVVDEAIEVPIEVRSIGTLSAQGVQVNITAFDLPVESAQVPGGTCSLSASGATCQLGAMPPNEVRTVTLQLRPATLITGDFVIAVSSTGDRNQANNQATTRVPVDSAADIAITMTTPMGMVRTPIDFSINLRSFGPRAARNVTATIAVPDVRMLSATSSTGSCTINQTVVNCSLGDIPSGDVERIDVTLEGTRVTPQQVGTVDVHANNDSNPANNHLFFGVHLSPAKDVQVHASATPQALIDAPFDTSFLLFSQGVEPSDPATVTISNGGGGTLSIDSATVAGGSCTVDAGTVVCAVGSIEVGGTRSIVLRARGSITGPHYLVANFESATDDVPGNNRAQSETIIAKQVDVSIRPTANHVLGYTGVPMRHFAILSSDGMSDASAVSVRVEFPAHVNLRSATLDDGSCNTTGQVATCTRAALPRGRQATFSAEITAGQAGSFDVPVTVTAAEDDVPTGNNRIDWSFVVQDAIDVQMLPATPATAILNVPQALTFTVANGSVPVGNLIAIVAVPSGAAIDSVSTQGSCNSDGPHQWQCDLGPIGARETRAIEARVRGTLMLPFTVTARAIAASDVYFGNDIATTLVTITERYGDASVQVGATSLTGQVGQTLAFPAITVAASATVDDVSVTIGLDTTGTSIAAVQAEGGSCVTGHLLLECKLGTIEAGTTRTITLTLQVLRGSVGTQSVTLYARNDTNAANNSVQVSVNLTSPPPPPPPPAPSGGGGGGGGGSMGLNGLLLLLLGAVARGIRKRPAVPVGT